MTQQNKGQPDAQGQDRGETRSADHRGTTPPVTGRTNADGTKCAPGESPKDSAKETRGDKQTPAQSGGYPTNRESGRAADSARSSDQADPRTAGSAVNDPSRSPSYAKSGQQPNPQGTQSRTDENPSQRSQTPAKGDPAFRSGTTGDAARTDSRSVKTQGHDTTRNEPSNKPEPEQRPIGDPVHGKRSESGDSSRSGSDGRKN